MFPSNPLLSACYSIPADKKRRIISQIGERYEDGRGNARRNAVTINNWLVDNHFEADPTLENIEGFIEEHFRQEEFFDERRPVDDDTEELAELERVRDEINQRIEELRDRIQEQNATDSIPDTLPDAPQPPSSDTVSSSPSPSSPSPLPPPSPSDDEVVQRLMKSLYDKPFGTDIPLIAMTIPQCEQLAPLLKEWYEAKIRSNELSKKIGIEFTVSGRTFFWPLHNEKTLEKINNMFNGSFLYSVDDIPSSISDGEAAISLSYMDNIRFILVSEYQKKDNERSHHPSAFFEYRLKDSFSEFEEILSKYQIFTHLDNDKHNKCREELKYNCLVYALKSKISDNDTLAKMSNYFINISHIPSRMLTDFCKTFNISIVLYTIDDKNRLRKANDKNGGRFGDEHAQYSFTIATFKNHYFVYEDVPVNRYYLNHMADIKEYAVAHHWDMKKCWKVSKKQGNNYRIDNSKGRMTSLEFVMTLFNMGAFQPLYRNDVDVDIAGVFHYVHNKQDIQSLEFSEHTNCKLIAEKKSQKKVEHSYYYADFETCYNKELNQEVEFMLCCQNIDGTDRRTFIGKNCGQKLLEYLPTNSVVYFHNLGFDGRLLLKYGVRKNIVKGSRIIQQENYYRGKVITLRDSYSMFTQKLANFPKCFPDDFKGLNIQKELFPYRYYTYERVFGSEQPIGVIAECGYDDIPAWNDAQRAQFLKNIDIAGAWIDSEKHLPEADREHFDMLKYCEFYCQQDVNVLRIGFNAFRASALKEPINLDIFNCLTAPALAQAYLNREVFLPNNNLYLLSGHVRDFVMKAIYGGRCMTKQNKRWRVTDKLDDFDACSLYPSAMARLFTVEGVPSVLPENMLNREYLLSHSFTEDQTEPTNDRFISYYVVEIEITRVGIDRDFPLIVERTKTNNMNVNKPVRMVVDMIELEDKITFQDIDFNVIRGYYWTGRRDHRIRETIRKLFQLRAEYKKQGNSIQQVIKLIMNSGYGKSIQKPIDNELKYIDEAKIDHYVYEHWHNIQECQKIPDSKQFLIKLSKTIDRQFNNCVFGVSVLSMSKRIMNEVMCLAEDLGINIYYQDTDSMHIEHDKINLLADAYRKKYHRELIGEDTIGCFHNDFDELKDAFTTLHISLGKKMYYDELANDQGGHAEHFRMKGIPNNVIINHAQQHFNNSVRALYEHLYAGNEITFNLNATAIRFVMEKTGEIKHKNKFLRKVKATSPPQE